MSPLSSTPKQVLRPPVKAACLSCRASKTRCDGHDPCSSCLNRGRECSYKASRRGGPRKGARYEIAKRHASSKDPDALPTPPNSVEFTDPILDNVANLFRQFSGVQNLDSPSNILSPTNSDGIFYNQTRLGDDTRNEDIVCENGPQNLAIRAYQSEADIVNAYYTFIHPCFPILPPPALPQYEDSPATIHLHAEESHHPNKYALQYWPGSPLTLALSSILVLIPVPGDVCSDPRAIVIRRNYAELYANSALESAEHDIELLGSAIPSNSTTTELAILRRTPIHPNTPLRLESLLTLVVLSVYQYSQRGNVSKMRTRANQAITTAMDMSLHCLGQEASEAERRAWWMIVNMVYLSSNLNVSPPAISIDDPRISTPYPEFQAYLEPWSIMPKAQHALFTSASMLKGFGQDPKLPLLSVTTDQIQELDSFIESLVVESDRSPPTTNQQGAEASAAESMWMIARIYTHTARISMHRFRAFLDIPIFLEKHCGLASINGSDSQYSSLDSSLRRAKDFEYIFPFTEQQSSSTCLKSALVVARAFKALPRPDPTYSELPFASDRLAPKPKSPATARSNHPRTIPYFACSAVQSCYALLMILYKIKASKESNNISSCYHLLSHPGPGTEVQDSERLMEEIRNAAESLNVSLMQSAMFEGVSGIGREIEGSLSAAFPD